MLVDYSVEKLHSREKIIKLILVCNPGLVNEYSKIDGISNSPADALIIFPLGPPSLPPPSLSLSVSLSLSLCVLRSR